MAKMAGLHAEGWTDEDLAAPEISESLIILLAD